ncbi:MAG: archease [Asgard group archaeon]|nr:archease [Asgard group archaeon]
MFRKDKTRFIIASIELVFDEKLSYKYLDHTADVIVHAEGKNLAEAFEQAALAFYDVITDIQKIEQKLVKKIAVQAEDIEALLFDWIDELIFLVDTELFIGSKINVIALEKNSEDSYSLIAEIHGEKFDITKHPQDTEVKAMTYSFMKTGENFVEFTLDL